MAIKSGASESGDLARVFSAIEQANIKAVIYFYSEDFAHRGIEREFASRFPNAQCIGASMIGGWGTRTPIEKGVTAISFSSDEVEEATVVFEEGVKSDPRAAAKALLSSLRSRLGAKRLNPTEYVGIILVDGLCLGEQIVKEFTVAQGFPIPLVGGAAADAITFTKTFVSHNARISGDGALVMVMKMKVPFFFNHYVHYVPTQRTCIVTHAEPEKRIIWEIEGKNAAEYYADMIGLSSANQINISHFSSNPLGVVIGDTVYTRSPNAVIDGKGLQFYCFIEAGTNMHLLRQGDIIKNANQALADAREYLDNVSGAILFNCILRYLEMKNEPGKLQAFADVFGDVPLCGFNTYGEELFTHHNQTLTALFFGR